MQVLFQPAGAVLRPSPAFVWAVGIENTFVPQARPGHRPLDEYALMGHDRRWREDVDRIADLGVRWLRYGIPWYLVNPAPGRFDWRWTDEVLPHLVAARGLTPIVDLVHFGTPLWLRNEFLAPDYPARVADYARAFAERYGDLVGHYTPCNEPAVAATRSGLAGAWPPYRRGVGSYLDVLINLNRGMIAAAGAIRAARPGAVLVHAEDVGLETVGAAGGDRPAEARQARRWLALDVACGRFRPGHPLWGDLAANPLADRSAAFEDLAGRAVRWDVLGVNYYPWSNRRWRARADGSWAVGRDRGDAAAALGGLLGTVHARYGLPVMVTETSAPGPVARRLAWLARTVAAVGEARAAGVPVVGYTWFPAFTMVDWRYRRSRRPIERHLLHLGLWDVPMVDGGLDRVATPLVEAYRRLAAGGAAPGIDRIDP